MRNPSVRMAGIFLPLIAVIFFLVTFAANAWRSKSETRAFVFDPPRSADGQATGGLLQLSPSIAVISGIPAVLTNATVSLNAGTRMVNYSIAGQAGEQVREVQLLLLGFDQNGVLRSANGWVERLGPGQNYSYPLSAPVNAQSRLAVAIVAATGPGTRWRAGLSKVTQALVNAATNRASVLPAAAALNNDGYEPDFCFQAAYFGAT